MVDVIANEPAPDQRELAKEVLEGKREIIASEERQKPMAEEYKPLSSMSPEALQAAELQGARVQNVAQVDNLPAANVTADDANRGWATPGENWKPAVEPVTPTVTTPDRDISPNPE